LDATARFCARNALIVSRLSLTLVSLGDLNRVDCRVRSALIRTYAGAEAVIDPVLPES
jgi:hypothetical protein